MAKVRDTLFIQSHPCKTFKSTNLEYRDDGGCWKAGKAQNSGISTKALITLR